MLGVDIVTLQNIVLQCSLFVIPKHFGIFEQAKLEGVQNGVQWDPSLY